MPRFVTVALPLPPSYTLNKKGEAVYALDKTLLRVAMVILPYRTSQRHSVPQPVYRASVPLE